jgi:V8-like Glu-specific endopeptidase
MPRAASSAAAARYLRKLSHGVAGARTGAVEAATAEALSPARVEMALERAIAAIEKETGAPLDPSSRGELERLFTEDGARAVEDLKRAGIKARLDPRQQDALEAIVEQDGSRPTLPLSPDDRLDVKDETLGQWQSAAKKFEKQIAAAAAAVGRIDVDGRHIGTGFVVKDGVVLTNRHVLQDLATVDAAGVWTFKGEPTITFDANPAGSRARQFRIHKRVVVAGRDPIDLNNIDPNKLDFAVLECQVDGGGFPSPLPLEADADKVLVKRPIFTIGYPAPPKRGAYSSDVLNRLFRHRYGVKRFAPGEIDRGIGSADKKTGDTVFAHDATTLGGNSGSCVIDFGNDGRLVVGLHFAGTPRSMNYAHSNARLRAALADAGFTWKDWVESE